MVDIKDNLKAVKERANIVIGEIEKPLEETNFGYIVESIAEIGG